MYRRVRVTWRLEKYKSGRIHEVECGRVYRLLMCRSHRVMTSGEVYDELKHEYSPSRGISNYDNTHVQRAFNGTKGS